MRAVRLYPLSCALNRAARWTLDSWLACSFQLLLPSDRRQPKRQLQVTFGKVEKTCVNNRLGILSLLYVKASTSLANGKQKTTKKTHLRISIYFCHFFGAPPFVCLVLLLGPTPCSFIQIQQQVVLQISCLSVIINDAALHDGWFLPWISMEPSAVSRRLCTSSWHGDEAPSTACHDLVKVD